MKTKRAISINNSMVHGICNCNCITCSVNKSSFNGPQKFQSEEVIRKIIFRVQEAAKSGIQVRYIANSGAGEPTLHPEFSKWMDLYGELTRNWNFEETPIPKIAIVTNGLNLNETIFNALVRNKIYLKISFPTSIAEHYGEIMMLDSGKGKHLLDGLLPKIETAMRLASEKKLPGLEFHISPPYNKYIRLDFIKTIQTLSKLAEKNNLKQLEFLLFPVTANRAGTVKNNQKIDTFKDFMKKLNNKKSNGVTLKFSLSIKTFYPNFTDFVDLVRAFNYPCIWYGNVFLSPDGDSCCCNDQRLSEKYGNVLEDSIQSIMQMKELKMPTTMCSACNQSPDQLKGTPFLFFFGVFSRIKLLLNSFR